MPQDKVNALDTELQLLKNMIWGSQVDNTAMKDLRTENAFLKEDMTAIQATMTEKHADFSKQWTTIIKKGAAAPKKEVISLEEDKRSSKALNVLVHGMPVGDTPMADAQALFAKMGAYLACESAWRVGKTELPTRPW